MTFREIEEFISRITYKPDIRLKVHKILNYDEIAVTLYRDVIDVMEMNRPLTLTSNILFKESTVNAERLLGIVVELIKTSELHEVNEWLKLDGKYINDPHPEITLAKEFQQLILTTVNSSIKEKGQSKTNPIPQCR
jgi:hypothetical protein